MPVTDKIQVFMTLSGDRFWTNVFHVNATDIDAAAAFANIVLAPTLALPMDGSFKVVKTLVSHLADDSFVTTPMSLPGGASGSAYLPLFNTVRILISVAGHGRNDSKYLRGIISEINQTNGQLESATVSAMAALYDTLITDASASGVDLVDSQGNLWQTATCQQAIQMRQLHRKRKKVVVP
jgi:hypothetical protein